jgi:hypothetical protein
MRWLCLITTISFFSAHAQIRKVTAETTVQQVTIFSSGAQVHRIANVTVPVGKSEINFSELSSQLQQQSVQLRADANITLMSVTTSKDFFVQRKIEQDEKNLLEKKEEMKEKSETDNKLMQVYKNEEQMLIKNESIGGQAGVNAEQLRQALDLHRQRLTEVYQKQLEIERRINDELFELAKVDAQLSDLSKKRDSIKYTVTALIDSKEARTIKFELVYAIKDAGWYPTYDVRVVDIQQPLNVLMNANVYQRSGESWKDVSIQLSSGNPTDNATPSKLQTWWVGYFDPSVNINNASLAPATLAGRIVDNQGSPIPFATVAMKGAHNSVSADGNGYFKMGNINAGTVIVISAVGFESKEVSVKPGYYSIAMKQREDHLEEVIVTGYGTSGGEEPGYYRAGNDRKQKKEEINPVAVATQYQPTTILYKIDEKYTLETDGKTITIGIKKIDVAAMYEYFAAPKIDPSVFLTAKIVNWQSYDLQSGEASLYFEGTYLGKTYLDLAAASDTLQLSLGKDNSINVSRKLVKEFSANKFLDSNKTDTRRYEIVVKNNKKLPINLILQDQFPISTTKEIEVNDTKAPDAQVEKETGIATWNLSIPASEEKILQISYEVKYPKDRRVVIN